ncbi:MAG: hypothetical protein L0H19_03630, partial [Salinisphaera sp.]|nr:hypothetical protein [Salinisphaera sp.]
DPLAGEVTIPGFPLKFSGFPDLLDLRAPLLGEHNDEVLRRDLALDDSEIAALIQSRILHGERR